MTIKRIGTNTKFKTPALGATEMIVEQQLLSPPHNDMLSVTQAVPVEVQFSHSIRRAFPTAQRGFFEIGGRYLIAPRTEHWPKERGVHILPTTSDHEKFVVPAGIAMRVC